MKNKRTLLMILDGWGIGNHSKADAIFQAGTPNMDKLFAAYPHSQLLACGEAVGLPEGQMGNSEVGHLNIGAGRVVYQDLVKVNKECTDGSIALNPVLVEAFTYAQQNDKAVHFMGLVSDGGVHSLDTHLYKLCDITKQYALKRVYIHALTDGRDTDPKSGYGFVEKLENHLKTSNGIIATLTGRYYTMDRDKRWERVREGYLAMVEGKGKYTTDILQSIHESYQAGKTDEFIEPIIRVDENNQPVGKVKEGDVFICFNFRNDRMREITKVLTQKDMPDYGMKTIPLHYLTITPYDDTFTNVKIIYDKDNVTETLGEVVAKAGKAQLRIAETEKYAHVTFFFSGGREDVFQNEDRILIPSPKVATCDLKPEMSAYEVKDAIIAALNKQKYDFVCLNFANGDMVGHTGIWEAIIEAIKTIDICVDEVVTAARANGYDVMIIADHGNADFAVNEDGSPNTAHSLNPVPCLLITDDYKKISNGILADVAPTLLYIMGIEKPKAMTGKVLVS